MASTFLLRLWPDLSIPSADTMMHFIKKEFEIIYSEVKQNFAAINSKISLTIDCWTSSSMKAFFGVIAHWISNWTMHEYTIDFANISDISHIRANLTNCKGVGRNEIAMA